MSPTVFGAALDLQPVTDADRLAFTEQLGRPPRGILAVAYRCAHDVPAVVLTAPRLEDGTPFPTMYYLCCRELNAAVSRMESAGMMREMTERLAVDDDLAERYRLAHESYLASRNALGDLGIAVTAGGMPDRVKCLHVLVAHSLAVGRGSTRSVTKPSTRWATTSGATCRAPGLPRRSEADPGPSGRWRRYRGRGGQRYRQQGGTGEASVTAGAGR